MGERGTQALRCPWCRKRMAASDDVCPHCGRSVDTGGLRPLGGGAEPVPGAGSVEDTSEGLGPLGESAEARAEEAAARMRGREEVSGEQAEAAAPPTERRRLRLEDMDQRYRVERMAPAEGQAPEMSWKYIGGLVRADRLFGVMLGMLGLGVVVLFLMGKWISAFMVGVMVWGVLTLQRWGYVMAMAVAGVFSVVLVVAVVSALVLGKQQVGFSVAYFSALLAVNVFVIGVLFARRGRFG